VLLLDLYMRRRPLSVTARDPDLIDLSRLLSRRVSMVTPGPAAWRSPDGLRARMSVFRVLDPEVETPDRKRALAGGAVWHRFANDPEGLRAAADAIRGGLARAPATIAIPPSRGPVAWSGDGRFARPDGDCWVYVLVLDRLSEGDPPVLTGAPYVKVGRSNDVDRRAGELNAGLPLALGLAWRVVDAVIRPSVLDADALEQRLLAELHRQGLTIGGEFIRGDPALIVGCLYDLM